MDEVDINEKLLKYLLDSLSSYVSRCVEQGAEIRTLHSKIDKLKTELHELSHVEDWVKMSEQPKWEMSYDQELGIHMASGDTAELNKLKVQGLEIAKELEDLADGINTAIDESSAHQAISILSFTEYATLVMNQINNIRMKIETTIDPDGQQGGQ